MEEELSVSLEIALCVNGRLLNPKNPEDIEEITKICSNPDRIKADRKIHDGIKTEILRKTILQLPPENQIQLLFTDAAELIIARKAVIDLVVLRSHAFLRDVVSFRNNARYLVWGGGGPRLIDEVEQMNGDLQADILALPGLIPRFLSYNQYCDKKPQKPQKRKVRLSSVRRVIEENTPTNKTKVLSVPGVVEALVKSWEDLVWFERTIGPLSPEQQTEVLLSPQGEKPAALWLFDSCIAGVREKTMTALEALPKEHQDRIFSCPGVRDRMIYAVRSCHSELAQVFSSPDKLLRLLPSTTILYNLFGEDRKGDADKIVETIKRKFPQEAQKWAEPTPEERKPGAEVRKEIKGGPDKKPG